MSTIASMSVALTADTSSFMSKMSEAASGIGALDVAIGVGIERLVEFGAHLVKEGAGAIIELTKSSIEAAHASSLLSDRIGVNVTDLMALEAAAKKTGSSAETLAASMGKFVKILGGAEESTNGGNAAKAADMLGLSLEDLQKNDKAEALSVIADRMHAIANSTQRAFIETSLFGKSGQELDGLMKKLADEGLDDVTKEALRTGEALTSIDASKLDIVSEDFETLKGMVLGLGNSLATQLAPYIDYVTQLLIDFANAHGGLKTMAVDAFHTINSAIGWVVNTLDLLQAGWYGFQSVVNTVVDFIVVGPLRGLSYAIDTVVVAFQNDVNMLIGGFNKVADAVGMTKMKMLSVNDTGLSSFFDKMHADLQKSSEEGAKGFTSHMDAYVKGKGHDDWMKFTDDIASNFEKKASVKAGEKMSAESDDLSAALGDKASNKTGVFRQIDTSRISAEGLAMGGKGDHPTKAQHERTNQLLEAQLLKDCKGEGVATVARG